MPDIFPVLPFVLVGALLYTSVGHGGATVYLALFTLFGFAIGPLVTTVLVLNIAAAAIAWVVFRHAGHLRWRLLVPFVVTSVPAAYVGGLLPLGGRAQAVILGLALLAAAVRFLAFPRLPTRRLPEGDGRFYAVAFALGAVLGFLAGATGIGGGVFLSPILVALGWATVTEAASVASAFIVLNSLAGLAAKIQATPVDPGLVAPLLVVVVIGAIAGSLLGARRLPPRALQVLLGVVLLVAAIKTLTA